MVDGIRRADRLQALVVGVGAERGDDLGGAAGRGGRRRGRWSPRHRKPRCRSAAAIGRRGCAWWAPSWPGPGRARCTPAVLRVGPEAGHPDDRRADQQHRDHGEHRPVPTPSIAIGGGRRCSPLTNLLDRWAGTGRAPCRAVAASRASHRRERLARRFRPATRVKAASDDPVRPRCGRRSWRGLPCHRPGRLPAASATPDRPRVADRLPVRAAVTRQRRARTPGRTRRGRSDGGRQRAQITVRKALHPGRKDLLDRVRPARRAGARSGEHPTADDDEMERRGEDKTMATDYDAPRRNESEEPSEDSLEELKARRNEAQSAVVDIDESRHRGELRAAGRRPVRRGTDRQGDPEAGRRVHLFGVLPGPAPQPVVLRRRAAGWSASTVPDAPDRRCSDAGMDRRTAPTRTRAARRPRWASSTGSTGCRCATHRRPTSAPIRSRCGWR